VEKYTSFLFPKNPRTQIFEVGAVSFDEKNGSKYEKEIGYQYRKNEFFAILMKQAQNFLVGGAGAFAFYPTKNKLDFRIYSVDPSRTILAYRDGVLVAVAYEEDFWTDENQIKKQRTFLDEKMVIRYLEDKEIERWDHDFGFVPFAWVPDRPFPNSFEGRSLVESLFYHDKQISEVLTNFGIRVNDNTQMEMAVFSDKSINTKNGYEIRRGRGQTHHVGKDDDIRFLEKPETTVPLDFVNFVQARIYSKTSIVESAGSSKNMVSGYSLSVQYSDMMDAVAKKRIPWNDAFRRLNRAILIWKFGSGIHEYETDPVYHSPLPLDMTQKIDDTLKLLQAGLITRYDAINEIRAVDDPKKVLDDIEKEKKEYPQEVDIAPTPSPKSEKVAKNIKS
jgi:hypothetical protein